MNIAKVQPEDYVQFLLGSPLQFTCTQAARVQPDQPDPPAHDAFNRLLTRLEPDPEALWLEARPQVRPDDGLLVLDDSTLDKPYARKMGLVSWHWSGNHHAVVKGINLLTLLWTDGDRHIPITGSTIRPTMASARTTCLSSNCGPPTSAACTRSALAPTAGTAAWRT